MLHRQQEREKFEQTADRVRHLVRQNIMTRTGKQPDEQERKERKEGGESFAHSA